MKMRWAWTLSVLSILALLGAQTVSAQQYAPPGYGGMPGMAAGYMAAPGQPGLLPDAYGAYGSAEIAPPMSGPMPGGPDMMPGMMGGGMDGMGMGACQYCGGMGCDACGGGMGMGGPHGLGNGLLGDVFGLVAPYPDGGCAAVRWYDFSVDFMMLRREDAGRRIDFATLGRAPAGPVVLSTSDIDFDEEPSFRFSAMMQVGPGSNVEFTYFGLFFWDEQATAASLDANPANRLFSVFSGFGTDPVAGFAETDESDFQSLDYESSFDSFEVNFRQRWVAPNCRYQGSWLVGVRYFKLDEEFHYFTQSIDNAVDPTVLIPSFNNDIIVHNNMTGVQVGGDLWMCILPGLRVGGELKGAVLGNRVAVENRLAVNTGLAPVVEDISESDVSFLAQADLLLTYRLNYNWTFRGGYQFLYLDQVALASENFNPVAPAILDPTSTRVPLLDDDGDVFYHGWFAGLEFMW